MVKDLLSRSLQVSKQINQQILSFLQNSEITNIVKQKEIKVEQLIYVILGSLVIVIVIAIKFSFGVRKK